MVRTWWINYRRAMAMSAYRAGWCYGMGILTYSYLHLRPAETRARLDAMREESTKGVGHFYLGLRNAIIEFEHRYGVRV